MASPPLVRDHTVGDQQAFWDEENDAVIYDDVTLRMDQIATLFRTEHRRCQRILYKELMLDASRFQHMSALRLQDRGNDDTVHWSFRDCPDNAPTLDGTDRFLLRTVEQSKPLTRRFVGESKPAEGGRV